MDIIKEAEAVVANRMQIMERDDVKRVARRFERDGIIEARAMEMALEVWRMSEEYAIDLYREGESCDGDLSAQ